MSKYTERRKIRAKIPRKAVILPGRLGDGLGNITVDGLVNYVFCRIGGRVEKVHNDKVPAQNDLLVDVGRDERGLFKVLSTRTYTPGGANEQVQAGYAPAKRYEIFAPGGGQDPLWVQKRQIMPLRIGPNSGMSIQIYAGLVYVGSGDYKYIAAQTLSLSSYIPVTAGSAALVLITVNTSGAIVATDGVDFVLADVTDANDMLTHIPDPPANTADVLAAVRVYNGQTEIDEGRTNTDIIDLRGNRSDVAAMDGVYLRLDTTNDPLTGDLDFGGYKAIAMTCDSGATLPSTPSAGQWFRHTPAGRNVLMQFTGSTWQPIVNFGATTVYVDPTGTDSQDKGFGTGTDAYATPSYAYSQVAGICGGSVNIHIAAGTYGAVSLGQKLFIGSGFAINFVGVQTTIDSGTVTSGVAGTGATRGTLTDTSKTWTTDQHAGRYITVNGITRVISSNTGTVLTSVSPFGGTPSGAYTISEPGVVFTSASNLLTFGVNTLAHTFTAIKFVPTSTNAILRGTDGDLTFTNCTHRVEGATGLYAQTGTKLTLNYCNVETAVTGAAIGTLTGLDTLLATGTLFWSSFGTKINNGLFSLGSGNYEQFLGCEFRNFAAGVYFQAGQSFGYFNSPAASGYNFFVNNITALRVDTGAIAYLTTNNQYSGNTIGYLHAWSLGETIIQAVRNAVASFIIRQLSGQTTNALEIQDSANAVHSKFAFPGTAAATENVFNEQGSPYLDQRMESDTETHMVWLDASADALHFGGQTNAMKLLKGGKVEFIGTATYFDDLPSPLIGQRLESPSSHIVLDAAEAAIEFKNNCDLTDYVITVPQITHRWKLGSAVGPHLHWEQTSASMPNWMIQYRWQRQGQAKNTTWTSQKYTTNAFTYVSGTLNQITAFGTITPPSGYNLSDLVDIRILRDTTNASGLFTGADPVATSVWAKSYDTHIEMDTLGSNDEYAK